MYILEYCTVVRMRVRYTDSPSTCTFCLKGRLCIERGYERSGAVIGRSLSPLKYKFYAWSFYMSTHKHQRACCESSGPSQYSAGAYNISVSNVVACTLATMQVRQDNTWSIHFTLNAMYQNSEYRHRSAARLSDPEDIRLYSWANVPKK